MGSLFLYRAGSSEDLSVAILVCTSELRLPCHRARARARAGADGEGGADVARPEEGGPPEKDARMAARAMRAAAVQTRRRDINFGSMVSRFVSLSPRKLRGSICGDPGLHFGISAPLPPQPQARKTQKQSTSGHAPTAWAASPWRGPAHGASRERAPAWLRAQCPP
eukprot:CAMPEP_0177199260 /NCGR_PEP_ID=MMETSP0367-20130122/25579_1 /TAXON_ID=447022 ORGANISM="Scrippsiella hangoei-like, Strain SHHI-4" /NCGR_SAMPLE_ID=MMETSP0367 /ASSEMBLY_ACC=CAM_ASM_000362 /LENGTH=165 /DNA_ID=CAMNT_0018647597 /DNA_START=78 /DNA_END=576 /DNA_ORIENTATION=+